VFLTQRQNKRETILCWQHATCSGPKRHPVPFYEHKIIKSENKVFTIYFRPAHQTQHSRTFELHLQPLPHFIYSTDFITQQSAVLCNLNSNL